MAHTPPLLVAYLATAILCGCTSGAIAGNVENAGLAQRCRTVVDNDRIAIAAYDRNAISVCAAGGDEDCLYTRESGKTYRHATPDLNADGRADAVIKDYTSAYGQHEVVHFMAFAQGSDGSYVKVADDMPQDMSVALAPGHDGWADLEVTRTCFNDARGEIQARQFRLDFDRGYFRYGPPNNAPELAEFCSAKEVALPAANGRLTSVQKIYEN